MSNVHEYRWSPSCVAGISDYFLLDDPYDLGVESSKALSITGLVVGELSGYVRSVMAYPITPSTLQDHGVFNTVLKNLAVILRVGSTTTLTSYDVPVYGAVGSQSNTPGRKTDRIYLGYVNYAPAESTNGPAWTQQEPYTTIDLYLPFYGYTRLKSTDVFYKRLYIYLSIDFATGSATYYITAGEYVDYNTVTDADGGAEAPLIATVTFQLGVSLALGETGFQNATRNALMGAVTLAASTVSGQGIPVNYETRADFAENEFRSTVDNARYDLGLQPRYGGEKAYHTAHMASPAKVAQQATNLLGFGQSASVNHANNAASDALSPTVPFLLIRRANFLNNVYTTDYKHLYGVPYAKTVTLSDLKTKTGSTPKFLQCTGMNGSQTCMTQREFNELTKLLQSGIYY